jgi:hypothetical protein
MAGTSRQHRGEKRRKELARKARQEEKRQRKAEKKNSGAGAGPPIDWEATEAIVPPASDPGSESASDSSQEVTPS